MGTGIVKRVLALVLIGGLLGLPTPPAVAQAPAAGDSPPPASLSALQLEDLVGRIALYPDDLVAILLPAADSASAGPSREESFDIDPLHRRGFQPPSH